MSRIPPPQHDPRMWPMADELLASVVRERDELRGDVEELTVALKSVLSNHCPNDKVFCSTCSLARTILADIKAEGR